MPRAIAAPLISAPAAHAAIVVAFDGDAIDRAVKADPEGLTAVRRFWTRGQPAGTIYLSDAWAQAAAAREAKR